MKVRRFRTQIPWERRPVIVSSNLRSKCSMYVQGDDEIYERCRKAVSEQSNGLKRARLRNLPHGFSSLISSLPFNWLYLYSICTSYYVN